jgi:lysophospholipid acyltransferase (LPLAT)-like uncharacterized protein
VAALKNWWRKVRPYILSDVIYALMSMVCSTLRIKVVDGDRLAEDGSGKIACLWHGRTIIPAFGRFWVGYWVIISHSRDGEMQSRIYNKLKFNIIRGSTGRGGVRAAVEAIRVLKKGGRLAITPDGPKGPTGVVQDGVIFMAKKAGVALYPMGISTRPRILAKSWDRYMIPVPFGKATVIIGEPIFLSSDASVEEEELVKAKLGADMHRLEAEAERAMGYTVDQG